MSEAPENWLDAMIERQALPEEIREGTTLQFCEKWGIAESTYYYQASKEENQKKIVGLALRNAKKHAPEVLENLGVRAKTNKSDAELYLKFILQLAEKTDITSGGEPIPLFDYVRTKHSDKKDTGTEEAD